MTRRHTGSGSFSVSSPSKQTEVPKRLFDGLALFGRARFDATTLAGAVRCTARRQAPKRLDMSDLPGPRDEAVMLLNDLLYPKVGRPPAGGDGPAPQGSSGGPDDEEDERGRRERLDEPARVAERLGDANSEVVRPTLGKTLRGCQAATACATGLRPMRRFGVLCNL